jgi:hypothetical protein
VPELTLELFANFTPQLPIPENAREHTRTILMKIISTIALAAALSVATFGTAMAQAPDTKPAATVAGKVSTASTVGTLLDNPKAKAVLVANVPGVVSNPMIEQARSMAFKELSQFEPVLTPDMLAKIDADLAKL